MRYWNPIKRLGTTAAVAVWCLLDIGVLNVGGLRPRSGRHSWLSPNWAILRR
jgi:hypothetical protein